MKRLIIFTIIVHSIYADLLPLSSDAIKAINAAQNSWKAGNGFGESTSIDINKLVSTLNESYNHDFTKVVHDINTRNFGEVFDGRSFWPECPSIGKIYDQRKGVPSWVYPTVGQIADRLCIKYGIHIDVEATVEGMIKANGGFNSEYNSADVGRAFKYWSKKGIYTVRSVNGTDCLPFAQCETQEIHFDNRFKVDAESPAYAYDIMRDIMQNGPLTVQMQVYADLPYYQSGIYKHKNNKVLGTHAVKVIGWVRKDSESWWWLVTNSWGPQWAEKGGYRPNTGSDEFGRNYRAFSAKFLPMDHDNSIPKHDQMFHLA